MKLHKNGLLRIVFLISLFVLGFLYTTVMYNGSKYDYSTVSTSGDVAGKQSSTQDAYYNIFMIETNEDSEAFTFKQLCSIESTARNNPEGIVQLKSVRAKIDPVLTKHYANINWSLMNFTEVFEGTPLLDWWKSDKLTRVDKYYRYSHLSDALRITFVYKYGGFYSDLDQIAIKNFKPLTKFSAIVNNNVSQILPESSFFHIHKNHSFLRLALDDYAMNYDAQNWEANGPGLLRRCIKHYCNTTNLEDLFLSDDVNTAVAHGNDTKCDMNILPYYIAYPYNWIEAKEMFIHNSTIDIQRFHKTYSIHFNGKVTRKYDIEMNENSIIEFFMLQNCPISYDIYIRK